MENKFPHGFFWGAATAAHQVEGGNINDWSEWEKQNANHLAQIANRKKWPDSILNNYPNPLQPENYISGQACDHYNRYEQDFDIAKQLGQNAHRFSIEWSRVQPQEGKFNEEAIEHYQKVILVLKARGIEPFITLWHFTDPVWISKAGGWENKKTIEKFLLYVKKITDVLGPEVKFWIPINEPSVYAGMGYIVGAFPPGVKNYRRANKVLKNLIKAHVRTYKIIHEKLKRAMVGSTHNLHYHVSYRKSHPLDQLATKILDYIRDTRSLNWSRNYQDFIGLNYYYRDTIKFVFSGGRFGSIDIKNPTQEVSDLGWDIYPEGIYYSLKKIKRYKKPIFITENGIADAADSKRVKFIEDNLKWTHKAIQEGADVRGYFYWSLLDNFEWDKGFWPRFGLVEIDYKTLERKIRPSAWEYAKICKNNSIDV